jgi:hypothetical protein
MIVCKKNLKTCQKEVVFIQERKNLLNRIVLENNFPTIIKQKKNENVSILSNKQQDLEIHIEKLYSSLVYLLDLAYTKNIKLKLKKAIVDTSLVNVEQTPLFVKEDVQSLYLHLQEILVYKKEKMEEYIYLKEVAQDCILERLKNTGFQASMSAQNLDPLVIQELGVLYMFSGKMSTCSVQAIAKIDETNFVLNFLKKYADDIFNLNEITEEFCFVGSADFMQELQIVCEFLQVILKEKPILFQQLLEYDLQDDDDENYLKLENVCRSMDYLEMEIPEVINFLKKILKQTKVGVIENVVPENLVIENVVVENLVSESVVPESVVPESVADISISENFVPKTQGEPVFFISLVWSRVYNFFSSFFRFQNQNTQVKSVQISNSEVLDIEDSQNFNANFTVTNKIPNEPTTKGWWGLFLDFIHNILPW